jgi:26S proteasome regulatory subunit N12
MIGFKSNSVEESGITAEILECGALLSLRAGDLPSFERHAVMLDPIYSSRRASFGKAAINETSSQISSRQLLQGLYLMHLLVATPARLADFHSVLERLSQLDRTSPTIAFTLALESHLSEGSYNRILKTSTSSLPSPFFTPFMTSIVGSVRDDIAQCAASAYPSLTVAAAQKMLLLESPEALKAYIHEKELGWHISRTGLITFPEEESNVGGGTHVSPTTPISLTPEAAAALRPGTDAYALMSEVIGFANSIERII